MRGEERHERRLWNPVGVEVRTNSTVARDVVAPILTHVLQQPDPAGRPSASRLAVHPGRYGGSWPTGHAPPGRLCPTRSNQNGLGQGLSVR